MIRILNGRICRFVLLTGDELLYHDREYKPFCYFIWTHSLTDRRQEGTAKFRTFTYLMISSNQTAYMLGDEVVWHAERRRT